MFHCAYLANARHIDIGLEKGDISRGKRWFPSVWITWLESQLILPVWKTYFKVLFQTGLQFFCRERKRDCAEWSLSRVSGERYWAQIAPCYVFHALHCSPLWSMAIGLLKGAPFNPAKKVNISRAIGRRWFSSVWRTSKECPKSPKSTPLYPVPCPPYFLYIVFVLQTPFQYLAHTWTTFWGTQRPQVAESGLPSARGFVQSIAIM